MGCVYRIGTKKTKQISSIKKAKPKTKFFSSLFGSGDNSTPQHGPSTSSPGLIDEAAYLELDHSSVELTIFMAEVDVKLSPKILAELHRSMRKNPPRTLKYELIYVCHPPMPVARDVNTLFRRGKTSMMQARKGTRLSPWQRIVSSKAFAQTWMGERAFHVWNLLLTLAQVRPCSRVHCESCRDSNELSLTWTRDMPPHKRLVLEDTWPPGSSPLSSESRSILCK